MKQPFVPFFCLYLYSRKTIYNLIMKTFILTNTFILLCLLPSLTWGQFVTISGYVNDSSNGKALENVSIFESNSGIGTISNQNGFYRLVLNDSLVNLQIANKGFKDFSQKMEIASDTTLVVKLEPQLIERKNQKNDDEVLQAGIQLEDKKAERRKPEFK